MCRKVTGLETVFFLLLLCCVASVMQFDVANLWGKVDTGLVTGVFGYRFVIEGDHVMKG